MLIGITGTIGSGKDTAMKYIADKYNFIVKIGSDLLIEEAKSRELPLTRENLQSIAREVRQKYGGDFLLRKSLENIDLDNKNVLYGSIRAVGDMDGLRELTDKVYIIAFDAPEKDRYKRITSRKSAKDNITFNQFLEQEKSEMHSDDPNKQNVAYCMEQSDFKIVNDGTLEEFHKKIDEVMANIKNV